MGLTKCVDCVFNVGGACHRGPKNWWAIGFYEVGSGRKDAGWTFPPADSSCGEGQPREEVVMPPKVDAEALKIVESALKAERDDKAVMGWELAEARARIRDLEASRGEPVRFG